MTKLISFKNKIFGDNNQISSERYFVTITTFIASIISLILCLWNLIKNPSIMLVMVSGSAAIVLLCLYYFVRFKNCLLIPKTILTVVGLIMLDFAWYTKFLSNGPVLLFILIFAALVIWIWEGRQLIFLMIFYFVNLLILFYIDYNAHESLYKYPDHHSRSTDIFVSFFFYSLLLTTLLHTIKKEYIRQKEKAIRSDKLKSAFLANMSHEIGTPMNGILGFSNLLKDPSLSGENQQEYIEIIEKSGFRMLNIINDIIDISRIEAGLVKLNQKESNINEKFKYVYDFFKPEAEAKGIKLVWRNSHISKPTIIKTDHEKVFAVLTNLVKNAIKYSDKGKIEIGYKTKSNYMEFYVKDTGIGITKDGQKTIFERFIQAEIEDEQARQGAGLGLSISKSYIEMLGGKIWVESQIGIGSTFYFTVPHNADSREKKANQKKLFSNIENPSTLNLKILIAEDDETSEMLHSIYVKEFCKKTLKAVTGNEAVDVCRNHPDIDLILMDIQMPNMNGYEATRQIREFNKEVIIIAQTAYGLSGYQEKALEAGCNDYISKPIKKEALVALIQKYFKS